jgi:hypothetical protein|tara:strand:- start:8862 stop:9038 length:177 start_codon:yes stop_codon:yes gene_type:complete
MEKKIKITYNSWGGVRDESKVIEAIQDKWCKDNGYPIVKRKRTRHAKIKPRTTNSTLI